MEKALEEMIKDNTKVNNRDRKQWGINDQEPVSADSIVQTYLRKTIGHESKLPAEGSLEVPENHLLVMIGNKATNMPGVRIDSHDNAILALAIGGDGFNTSFNYLAGVAGDPNGVDVTFEKRSKYDDSEDEYTGLEFNTRGGARPYIDRALLVGPGDNVRVRKGFYNSTHFLVSNIAGELYVDGKRLSSHDFRTLHGRLGRITDTYGKPVRS